MIKIVALCAIVCGWSCLSAEESVLFDLEAFAQDYVLETKKIEIPGFEFPFNPSIIRWRGQLLLSFRIIPPPVTNRTKYNSEIGLVFLNEDLEPSSKPQLVTLREELAVAPCRAEDARLITIGDRLFMVYDDNAEAKLSKGGFRMYVSELFYDGEHFITGDIEMLGSYEGESREIREKAWVPFVYNDYLLLSYSLVPHKVFFPRLDGSGICDTVALSENPIPWDFGILRGGTPGFIHGDEYLAFFHSSKKMATVHSDGNEVLHYFIGAYTFSTHTPFEITSFTPKPIIGKNFYNGIRYEPYWKPINCVFPCGYVSDDKYIWLAYGRDDHECWIAKLDKSGLFDALVAVKSP